MEALTGSGPQAESGVGREDGFPSLRRQLWNLAGALTDFVSDGCTTVSEDQYRQRLAICDTCEHRRNHRCGKCGCRLRWKARGRAFRCPLGKWPRQ